MLLLSSWRLLNNSIENFITSIHNWNNQPVRFTYTNIHITNVYDITILIYVLKKKEERNINIMSSYMSLNGANKSFNIILMSVLKTKQK